MSSCTILALYKLVCMYVYVGLHRLFCKSSLFHLGLEYQCLRDYFVICQESVRMLQISPLLVVRRLSSQLQGASLWLEALPLDLAGGKAPRPPLKARSPRSPYYGYVIDDDDDDIHEDDDGDLSSVKLRPRLFLSSRWRRNQFDVLLSILQFYCVKQMPSGDEFVFRIS